MSKSNNTPTNTNLPIQNSAPDQFIQPDAQPSIQMQPNVQINNQQSYYIQQPQLPQPQMQQPQLQQPQLQQPQLQQPQLPQAQLPQAQNSFIQYNTVYPNVPVNEAPENQSPPTYEQSVDVSTMILPEKSVLSPTQPVQPQPQNHEVILMINETQVPRHSFKMKCPHCNKTVDTTVQYEDNVLVWGLCIILFIFTFLCCIPFCITDLKDAVHYCPICRNEIARRDRVI